jgi:hypothetical protein
MTYFKIVEFKIIEDWGKDYRFSFLKGKKYAVLQVSFSICEALGYPYIQVQMGSGKLFGFFTYAWRLGLDLDICGRNWGPAEGE